MANGAVRQKRSTVYPAGKRLAGLSSKVVFIALFCILIGMQERAFSAPAIPPDADQIYSFAAGSYEDGDYTTALVEFKRFLFFYPDDTRAAEAAFKIGMANFKEGRYPQAIEAFETVTRKYAASGYAAEAVFMLSQSYMQLNDQEAALTPLVFLADRTSEPAIRDRALYRIGWIHLQSGDLPEARAAFSAISEQNKGNYRIDEIMERLDHPQQLPHKSPLLAAVYGVIPGGGYLYNGLYREAGIAFFLNTALAAAAYESFDNELYALGGIISLAGLGFYSGSIYGGISAAHKYNQRAYGEFIHDLETQVPPNMAFHIEPKDRSVLLSFNFSF